MRHHLFLLVFTLFTLTVNAKEQPVTTSITGVKVFLSGAEVTRTGKAELVKGTTVLLFAGLSEEVDPSNIQVSGSGQFTILGVQHRLNYLEEKKEREGIAELKTRIKTVEEDITREQALLDVLEKEDARLAKNDFIAGDQGLSLEQLRSVNDYLQARQETLALKRIERRARLTTLNDDLLKLRLQLGQLQGKRTRPTSEVLVEVSANAPVDASLVLKYLVRSAGWSPNYDIRVADVTKPLQLTYKANVFQNTGEDWDKVQLALSSGEPNKDAVMPELFPWRLDFGHSTYAAQSNAAAAFNANIRDVRGIIRDASTGEPLPFVNVLLLDANGQMINGTTSNMDGYYAIAVPANGRSIQVSYVGYTSQNSSINGTTMNIALTASAVTLDAVTISGSRSDKMLISQQGIAMKSPRRLRRQRDLGADSDYRTPENTAATTVIAQAVVQRTTTFEFAINVPYSIPSDGQNHQVGVQEKELPGTYRYYCTPKLDLDAFLFAEVTGWEGLNLLAGPAYIYFEGTYVGESLLDLSGVGDTLDISLGRDKGVTVQRTKRKELCTKQLLGSKRVETISWEIALRNNKPQAVDVLITDQYPVPVRSEIEVKLDENADATVNTEKGFLTWKSRIEPRTNKQWRFGYSVKVPKEQIVVLE